MPVKSYRTAARGMIPARRQKNGNHCGHIIEMLAGRVAASGAALNGIASRVA
ncbi:MAG: hypothetical protein IDH49_05925 [Gammaproteobacteria bacterium]|nr:hypothetical protein [Gammaproteobacteria bacterium]